MKNHPHHQKPTSGCSVWYVLYVLCFLWLAVLYFYHHNHHPSHATTVVGTQQTLPSSVATIGGDFTPQRVRFEKPKEIPQQPVPAQQQQPQQPAAQEEVPAVAAKQEEVVTTKDNNFHPIVSESNPMNPDRMHIVFSTDCTFFQDWQTLLLFYSAQQAHQLGDITRIASGCSETKQQELTTLYHKLFPQYHVHFTPDFKTDNKTKKSYDFYNKPFGLQHWLQHANPVVEDGVVVILIDPDMIILRPFTLDLAGNPANIFHDSSVDPKDPALPKKIGKGVPVAQVYGLGAPWAVDGHRHFNRLNICGENSPCLQVTRRFGEMHYSVGPPYLIEKTDMLRITSSWTKFVPRVFEKYPELLAEMYAYSMAAAHENLPHYIVRHQMISNTDMDEEGWSYVDVFEDHVCDPPVDGVFYPGHILPNILHYCQFYRSGELGFQKRRIHSSLFQCDQPMMAAIPSDQGKIRYKNRDGEIMKLGPTQARRNTFMLCVLHRTINNMVQYYKSKMCATDQINHEEAVNLVDKKYWS